MLGELVKQGKLRIEVKLTMDGKVIQKWDFKAKILQHRIYKDVHDEFTIIGFNNILGDSVELKFQGKGGYELYENERIRSRELRNGSDRQKNYDMDW